MGREFGGLCFDVLHLGQRSLGGKINSERGKCCLRMERNCLIGNMRLDVFGFDFFFLKVIGLVDVSAENRHVFSTPLLCFTTSPKNFELSSGAHLLFPYQLLLCKLAVFESVFCIEVLLPLAREMHVGSFVGFGGPSQDGFVGDVANYRTPSRWPVSRPLCVALKE